MTQAPETSVMLETMPLDHISWQHCHSVLPKQWTPLDMGCPTTKQSPDNTQLTTNPKSLNFRTRTTEERSSVSAPTVYKSTTTICEGNHM